MGIGDNVRGAAENALKDLAGLSEPNDDAHAPEPGDPSDEIKVHSSISEGSNAGEARAETAVDGTDRTSGPVEGHGHGNAGHTVRDDDGPGASGGNAAADEDEDEERRRYSPAQCPRTRGSAGAGPRRPSGRPFGRRRGSDYIHGTRLSSSRPPAGTVPKNFTTLEERRHGS